MTQRGAFTGSVRWAVVPYTPRPPFRLYAGEGHPPIAVETPDRLLAAAREPGSDAEFTYLVPAKVRPVLLLTDPPHEHHRDVLGLRLLRLSSLDPERQQAVREHREELLFPLPAERFTLPEECAAMVSAVVPVHVNAIASEPAAGMLEPDELRTIGERLIAFFRFDTTRLVERRLRELARRLQ